MIGHSVGTYDARSAPEPAPKMSADECPIPPRFESGRITMPLIAVLRRVLKASIDL
jgi:hypothetical protein